MADPTFVQASGFTSGSATDTVAATPAISTTTGNFLFVLVGKYQSGRSITGVTDTAGSTYTRAGSSQSQDASHTQEIWYTASPITGNASNVVTASFDASTAWRTVIAAEFSLSGATACAYDAEASLALTANGTTYTSNSLTTGGIDALVLGGFIAWTDSTELSDGTGTIMWETGAAAVDDAAFAYRLTDAAGSYSISLTGSTSQQFTVNAKSFTFTASGGDTTAPVLSSPTGTATGSSTATIGATTDEGNGTLYAVVDTVTTTPSQAELEAGQDGDGGAAAAAPTPLTISSTGAKTFNVTGLAPNTTYSYFIGHKDAAGNFSNIVSGTFTTFQRSAPASDVSAGSWTASSGSDLFAMIDEASPSDADYIKTATAADVCTVALGSLSDPSASTGHQVSYRISGDGTSGMQVDLLQGTTVIATWTHDPAPASPTTYSQTLTGTEADAITDYTALRLRFTEV